MSTRVAAAACFMLSLILPTVSTGQASSCPVTVSTVSGEVTTDGSNASTGMALQEGVEIETSADGNAQLTIGDDKTLKVGPNSVVLLEVLYCSDDNRVVRFRLKSGTAWAHGSESDLRFELSTEHYVAMVGNSTMAATAVYIDSTFHVQRATQKIETRDWEETVEVESESFQFTGETARVYAIEGDLKLVPWGERLGRLSEGSQRVFGFRQDHISSEPTPINEDEMPFSADGSSRI